MQEILSLHVFATFYSEDISQNNMEGFLPKRPINQTRCADAPGVHFVEDEFQRMLEPGWGDGCLISEVPEQNDGCEFSPDVSVENER